MDGPQQRLNSLNMRLLIAFNQEVIYLTFTCMKKKFKLNKLFESGNIDLLNIQTVHSDSIHDYYYC